MFQDDLNEEQRGWSWQRRRGAERQNNQVHYDEDAKSIQERARDDMSAQERNSVDAQDKNANHHCFVIRPAAEVHFCHLITFEDDQVGADAVEEQCS